MEFRIYHVTRYQCPLGLMLHFYKNYEENRTKKNWVSMPFRAGAPFLRESYCNYCSYFFFVSMPSRAGAPFLHGGINMKLIDNASINVLSGWGFISTKLIIIISIIVSIGINALSGWGFISTSDKEKIYGNTYSCINALSG